MSLLSVNDLLVRAGDFALAEINLALAPGDYHIILGPTGSGKTVLLESLAGLRKVEKGSILFKGEDITWQPPEKRFFGFAYQDSLLYPFLNVQENILFAATGRGIAGKKTTLKRLEELVHTMGISHLLNRYPHYLSGGEKQRVSLARALLLNPPLLLLDEPLSALDPQTRNSLQLLLKKLNVEEGLSIIHVTHDFKEALTLGTQMTVLMDGKTQMSGKPEELYLYPTQENVARFLGMENLQAGFLQRQHHQWWFRASSGSLELGPLTTLADGEWEERAPVWLMVRASNLDLTTGEGAFCWPVEIEQSFFQGFYVQVTCRGNGHWEVHLPPTQWQQLQAQNKRLCLKADPANLHFITRK